jgi:hypothetical protein
VRGFRGDIAATTGTTTDLGAWQVGSAPLRVRAVTRDGPPTIGARVLLGGGGRAAEGAPLQTLRDGVIEVADLAFGRYELTVWGESIAPTHLPIVHEGAHEPVTIVTTTATRTELRLAGWPDGASVGHLVLRRDGAPFRREVLVQPRSALVLGLPPGSYRADVTTMDAVRRGAAEFVVGATAGPPIEILLRP